MTKKAYFHIYLKIILCLIVYLTICPALPVIAKQELRGKVYILGENDKRFPVTNTTVRIQNTDDSDITTSTGRFRIYLPDVFKAGETVTLEVEKPKYQILHPFAGEVRIPASSLKDPVEILLDKEGSHRFMSGKAFALLIENIANKPKSQVEPVDERKEVDLSRYINEWAIKYGFGIEHVQAELDKWAAEVEARQEDFYELALAAFYKKNFKEAADMSYQSAEKYEKQFAELNEQEKRINEKKQQIKENIIRDYRLAGDAQYNDYRFEEALSAYLKALAIVNKDIDPIMWASLMDDISATYWNLGFRVKGIASRQYLNKALEGLQAILKIYTRETFAHSWAMTQNNLGNTFSEQGKRIVGEEGVRLLNEAVKAYKAALTVVSRESLPQKWAMIMNNLGLTLSNIGIRTSDKDSIRLLSEADEAYRLALTVKTLENMPQSWAVTMNNIGIALKERGIRTEGEEGVRLLNEAVKAYNSALMVRTRESLPQDWAVTKYNIGNALKKQGIRTRGEKGLSLLSEAVNAYNDALTVFTRESLPMGWASTQNNMGNALKEQGIRTDGIEGARLLAEAIKAYKAVLTVDTCDSESQDWAMTQNNLAETYYLMNDWANAVECYCNVLKVYQKYDTAYNRASYIYHEQLFQFDKAYELSYEWVIKLQNVTGSSKSIFIVTNFTTARFDKAEELLAELLPKLNPNDHLYAHLCAIEIANLVALKKTDMVSGKIDALISTIKQQPVDYKIGGAFNGTKHFIKNSEQLKPDSQWLLSFFAAIEDPNRDTIIKGLQEVQKDLNKNEKQ
ncbi:MAG: tetratricopeptide repeat protein [Proteobacteria bacterium]|nr:tetratricopeptide repeat protein [Pseudomonadota bacterium]